MKRQARMVVDVVLVVLAAVGAVLSDVVTAEGTSPHLIESLEDVLPTGGLRRPKTGVTNRAAVCGDIQTINFNDFHSGAPIDDTVEFPDGVRIYAKRLDGDEAGSDGGGSKGMIYDAVRYAGREFDLGHFPFLKKMLIVSKDRTAVDAAGEIIIDFGEESNVQMHSIRFVNFDTPGSDVGMFGRKSPHDAEVELLRGFKIPVMKEGGQKRVHMSETGIQHVKIRLLGGGAVDDIEYRRCNF